MPIWSAERTVDEPLVRRLLSQFDEVDTASLRRLSQGWDYSIWAVGEQWAFRFPRRDVVLPGMKLEIAVVPKLAPLLPIPVPAALLVGEPTADFPWPFFGSRFLPGRDLAELELDDGQRLDVGLQLARFLRVLHAAEIDVELPPDSNRRADMSKRVPRTREQLAELEQLDIWEPPGHVERLLVEAEALPPSLTETIVHGDLHFRQLLADEGGQLSGVLDWVDVCRSDPAIDLCMLWGYLRPPARGAFLDAYGPVDDAQLLRARVVALSVWASLAHYGRVEHQAAIEREAVAGLSRTVS
jgi:aminoglycoside phosphotransferase (APT) family kinase protein